MHRYIDGLLEMNAAAVNGYYRNSVCSNRKHELDIQRSSVALSILYSVYPHLHLGNCS